MTIQNDAGELLALFYELLVNKNENMINTTKILEITKWEGKRLDHAYNYLNDMGILKSYGAMGNINGAQIFMVARILPEGINIIENPPKFKETFGYTINLGIMTFSWSTEQ